MDTLFHLNWKEVFLPTLSIAEIFLRGSLVYLVLFTLLRFVSKREAGTLSLTDLLVLVLIADAAQNAMAGDYTSITDGLLLVATIIFWAYTLDWLGYRFPLWRRFVHPPPLPLVKDGRLLRQNLRRELLTEEELMSQLREQGIDNLTEVKAAYMEGDGRIGVITHDARTQSRTLSSP